MLSILPRTILNSCTKLKRILPTQPCLLCGAMSRHGAWCTACDASLPTLPAEHCPNCALPTPAGTHCGNCLKKPPPFARTIAAFAYSFPLDKMLQALKFHEHLYLAPALADKLAICITERPDCIVPMPLHPQRLKQRGHNQSLEIARHIASRLDVPLLANTCHRVRDTPPQSSLRWKARSKNMHKAFQVPVDFTGMHVAMVDDVMTSGASFRALAQALRRAGASEVSAWVVARTLPHHD